MRWLALIPSLALGAYVCAIWFESPVWLSFVAWIVIGAIAHDMVLLPLYTALGFLALGADWALWGDNAPWRGKRGELRVGDVTVPFVRSVNYIRTPAIVCGVILLVYFPLIFGLSEEAYVANTALDPDVFLGRYLLIVAGAFLISGILYALAVRRAAAALKPSDPATD